MNSRPSTKFLLPREISDEPGIGGLLTALISKPRLQKVVGLAGEGSLLSADGRRVVTGTEAGIQMLDAFTGEPVGRPFAESTSRLRAVSWDGRYVVVTIADNDIRVWDSVDGRPVGPTITGSRIRTSGAPSIIRFSEAVSADGYRLASAEFASDHDQVTVRLWDARTGREISSQQLTGDDYATDLKFNPNGRTLAIGTFNGAVTLRGHHERAASAQHNASRQQRDKSR